MRALIAGWFSIPNPYATVGDVLAAEVIGDWLNSRGIPFDIATATPSLHKGITLEQAHAETYTHVIAVCGPYGRQCSMKTILDGFGHCKRLGIDLSILGSIKAARAEFDALFERDSPGIARPELAFVSRFTPVPVVGLLLVHPQDEYGSRALHGTANSFIERLLQARECASVKIDTLLENNPAGFRTAREIESVIARMDFVITTRLHGTVFALKHGVPALAIDPIARGAKISAQCRAVGWPVCFTADRLDEDSVNAAFSYCSSVAARELALGCGTTAATLLDQLRGEFLQSL